MKKEINITNPAEVEPFNDVVGVTFQYYLDTKAQETIVGWKHAKISKQTKLLNKQVNLEVPNSYTRRSYFLDEKTPDGLMPYSERLQERQQKVEELFATYNDEIFKVAFKKESDWLINGMLSQIINGFKIDINSRNTPQVLDAIFQSFLQGNGSIQFPRAQLDRQILKEKLDQDGVSNAIRLITEKDSLESQRKDAEISIRNKAIKLGLTAEEYKAKVETGNLAYKTFCDLGPFYGTNNNDVEAEPTWKVAAEALEFPNYYLDQLNLLGSDLYRLSDTLPNLPSEFKAMFGYNAVFDTRPITLRPDIILDKDGNLRINEIETDDGATALIAAEQVAYGLKNLEETTPGYLLQIFRNLTTKNDPKILWLRDESKTISDSKAMKRFIYQVSDGQVSVDYVWDREQKENILLGNVFGKYDMALFASAFNQYELAQKLGLPTNKVIPQMSYSAIGNKALFALIHDPALEPFWTKELNTDIFERLKEMFITSKIVKSAKMALKSFESGDIVKISKIPTELRSDLDTLMGSGKGVWGLPLIEEQKEKSEALATINDMFNAGCGLIAQDFIEPADVKVLVRKNGGKSIENFIGKNRICAKYCATNSDQPNTRKVILTGAEATIGPGYKPAGRECSFTAVKFLPNNRN